MAEAPVRPDFALPVFNRPLGAAPTEEESTWHQTTNEF